MKYFIILVLPVWLLVSSCESDEKIDNRGTVLKELITKDSKSDFTTRIFFEYDDLGNIIKIENTNYRLSTEIKYHNGNVSWVNNDSLVYKNGVLTKTIYVGDDTTFVRSEFEIDGNFLYKKTTYLWASGGYMFPGSEFIKPHVVDTATTVFEYDGTGNVIKTDTQSNRFLLMATNELTNLLPSGEFSYDDKPSPFVSFANELKFILSINPGPNNWISKEIVPRDSGIPYYISVTYEYNLDNHPVKRKQVLYSGEITTFYRYY